MDDRNPYNNIEDLIASLAGNPEEVERLPNRRALTVYSYWNNLLSARIDYAIEFNHDEDIKESVAKIWLQLSREKLKLRMVLDDLTGRRQDLDAAVARECRILAIATGLASVDENISEAALIGAEYLSRIRSSELDNTNHNSSDTSVDKPVGTIRRIARRFGWVRPVELDCA